MQGVGTLKMKLYSFVDGERGKTIGKGGNRYLRIKLCVGTGRGYSREIATIQLQVEPKLSKTETEHYTLKWFYNDTLLTTRGNEEMRAYRGNLF